jgi:hypothetical protein
MGKKINIHAGSVTVSAEMNDSSTAEKVYDSLPIEGTVNTWGDEIYFEIPVQSALDDTAREVVEMGDLGYWPTGQAFCIFFGPTPASREDEIRPASAVNILGKVLGDPVALKGVRDGESVTIEKK